MKTLAFRMMWTAVVVVLSAALVMGQHYSTSQCPTMHVKPNFDPREFLGTWHIYQQYRVDAEKGMSCKTVTLKEDGTVKFEFVARSRLIEVEGSFLVDSDSAGLLKAKFDYADVLGSDSTGVVVWSILSTDYGSHAVLAACQEGEESSKQYLYVLSRHTTPSSYHLARMDANFRTIDEHSGGILETQEIDHCGKLRSKLSAVPSIRDLAHDNQDVTTQIITTDGLERNTGSPSVIHINIADSSISVNADPTTSFKANDVAETTPNSYSTSVVYPPATAESGEGEITTPSVSMYEEITLEGDEGIEERKMDFRVASFINRLQKMPNFIEWSDITSTPTFRIGTDTRSPVDRFINSLKHKPNFVDFAHHEAGLPYRKGIRIFRNINHK
ncbi:Lipocalin/cytosolic fatty-acid binding domain [Trinorchestia longiramus]|nr:Lipocalin/cytosolic fatty-acid binding domain [Trinorchestia longiramus]